MNLDPGTTIFMGFVIPVAMFLLNQIFNRGDKSDDKTSKLAAQVAEVVLQISALRTELAQQELARHRDMEARFVLRREYEERERVLDFTKRLTLETHKRLHPDAAIHEPGALHV